MSNMRYISGTIAIGFVFAALIFGSASASFGTSVGSIQDDVSPGQHVAYEINVTAANDSPALDLDVGVFGFGQSLDGSYAELKADQDKGPYSARAYLKLDSASLHLEPGETKKMVLEGDIPSDVGSGARYAIVSIRPPDPKNVEGVSMIMGIDIPVILRIKDTEMVKTGEISKIELDSPILAEKQNLSLIFNNTGNIHYRVLAKADIKDKDGNVLTSASTEPSFSSIIPPNSLLIELALSPEKELESGDYSIASEVSSEDGEILATKELSFNVE